MFKLYNFAAAIVLMGSILAAVPARAGSYKVVYNFQGGKTDAAVVVGGLLKVGNMLYGTSQSGGANGFGTVFSTTPAGIEKVIYSFQGGGDGAGPRSDLINVDGILYGTTALGGPANAGTVFRITPAGVETVLYAFIGNLVNFDGIGPQAGLVNIGPRFYGTTAGGGGPDDLGTVYQITPAGVYKQLRYFTDNHGPRGPVDTLIAYKNHLLGTTFQGGSSVAYGTVFEMTHSGDFRTLHSFGSGLDVANPVANVINVGHTFYGTSQSGGADEFGGVYSMTRSGIETVLYSFTGVGKDGGGPAAALIDVDGTLYGVTGTGYNKKGYFSSTLFSITPAGTLTTLHRFGTAKDGDGALGNLIQVGHALYGTTAGGGTAGQGTVFKYKL
jgi:uncharacterized repeat protein (TIGR03803 family)